MPIPIDCMSRSRRGGAAPRDHETTRLGLPPDAAGGYGRPAFPYAGQRRALRNSIRYPMDLSADANRHLTRGRNAYQ